jgi:hypothetical protein
MDGLCRHFISLCIFMCKDIAGANVQKVTVQPCTVIAFCTINITCYFMQMRHIGNNVYGG